MSLWNVGDMSGRRARSALSHDGALVSGVLYGYLLFTGGGKRVSVKFFNASAFILVYCHTFILIAPFWPLVTKVINGFLLVAMSMALCPNHTLQSFLGYFSSYFSS